MDEEFDYSRYKYFIAFVLDHSYLYTEIDEMGGYFEYGNNAWNQSKYVPSFVYDTTSKTVIAEGDSADKLMSEAGEPQENLLYIPNAFTELYNTSAKQQEGHCEKNWFDDVVLQVVIKILQMQVDKWKEKKDCSEAELCYVFTIPTGWNEDIKEEFIRPLFVKSGLINEEDDLRKLSIFTHLELNFRYLQFISIEKPTVTTINQGHQYIIMSLDFHQDIHVNLNLVSAQYPGFKTVDSGYVPQLLKEFDFVIPFRSHSVKSSLTAYLEKQFESELVLEIIDQMLETLNRETIYYRNSKKEFDLMIDNIRLLTVGDVFEDFIPSVAKNCMNGINTLLQGTDNIKARSLAIVYTKHISDYQNVAVVLSLVEKWVKTRSEEQDSPYELIGDSLNFVYKISGKDKLKMASVFVRKQMNDFNVCRDPIILPRDSSDEEYGSSLKPVYFLNIDLLPTKNKITLTYVDEKSRIEQIESIDCNIQPLHTFFKQSEMYQRFQLHINYGIKTHLETLFAEYLTMYSKSNQKTTLSSLLQPASEIFKRILGKVETKSSFGDYLRIHTSRNWSKEIRNLFASSGSHLLEELMKNAKMDSLFALRDNSENDEEDLLVTSDPGYIFFFIVAYLHNLKTSVEIEIKGKFGNDLRGKNIWYGVSVDKHLLDTVFVSKKKLEKLFYASGILVKDDNLRRAKFCVRGEDILPAIQQTLDLNLRMKSYFVVAQIFPRHVQLTLHQTVKLASPGEDAASIIIEDKTVHFDDVYDELCKKVWENIQSNCQLDYCITHKDKNYTEHDFGSLQAYRDICQTLKQRILELLKNDSHNVDMNLCTKFNVNKKCSCHMVMSLRLVIEKGLQQVLESIVRTIAATLANYDLFGNYKTDHIFVLGDPFNLSYDSHFYAVYTTILQRAMDEGIKSKGKDTQAFVMKDSLDQLLYLFKIIKPHMFDRFIKGTLCMVPGNTYGIGFSDVPFSWNRRFVHVARNGDIKHSLSASSDYLILFEKGRQLSTTATMIKVRYGDNPTACIIRVKNPCSTKLEKHDILDVETAKGSVNYADFHVEGNSIYDLIVELI
ncbi:hypothetical protein INT47_007858 [Mucor saturninus]|uniref:Uncharacterized protein n=1 Tax=Mucor saturninus TaxID=64648 RepID=A0A8H7RD44_9FUNG|nr:hypothetical protein INT47_007858 [Mucor saturninus]